MSRFLRSREFCPIHHSYFCEPCHKPAKFFSAHGKKQPRSGWRLANPTLPNDASSARPRSSGKGFGKASRKPAVEIIEDVHAPKGYREICSDQELERRKKRKLEEQHGCCAGPCARKFGSFSEVLFCRIWPELHHIANSKMGAAFKDDSYDNLQCLCRECHDEVTGKPQWSGGKSA